MVLHKYHLDDTQLEVRYLFKTNSTHEAMCDEQQMILELFKQNVSNNYQDL